MNQRGTNVPKIREKDFFKKKKINVKSSHQSDRQVLVIFSIWTSLLPLCQTPSLRLTLLPYGLHFIRSSSTLPQKRSETTMETGSPRKIQFTVPLLDTHLDPEAAEQV